MIMMMMMTINIDVFTWMYRDYIADLLNILNDGLTLFVNGYQMSY